MALHPVTTARGRQIDPMALRQALSDGAEIALVDVRDGAEFADGHLLVASNLPLSRLEVLAPALLPRTTGRIVLVDGGDGLAERAAELLIAHGYTDVSVLAGGQPAWIAAGYRIFSGVSVPSKAFGELIEHRYDTPRIEPETLAAWQREGRDLLMVDARPQEEFRMISLPGARCCPGAELVARVPALLKSAQTTIVVNCAGRTRSIIGCQSLRNAGIDNPVYALKNGTMGWTLRGLQTAQGQDELVPEADPAGLSTARRLAAEAARRQGVRFVDASTVARMRVDPTRTTYLFDVRLPQAFAEGHVPGSLNAPGGQLVQNTDTYVAVRNARIVLIDRDRVQAPMTAHWLRQMGWREVFVFEQALSGPLELGAVRLRSLGHDRLDAPLIRPHEVAARLQRGAMLVDVGDSFGYRSARIPGASYAMRSMLDNALRDVGRDTELMICCGDGQVSRHAAQDARTLGFAKVSVLDGGRAAWRAAGLPVEPCEGDRDPKLLTPTRDMWYPPWVRETGVEASIRQYLSWEVDLLDQIASETYLQFDPEGRTDPLTEAT